MAFKPNLTGARSPTEKRWVRCYIDIAFPAYCLPNWTREERRVTCAQHVSVLIDRCVRQSGSKMSSFPAIRPQSPPGGGSKRFESFATWQVEVCKSLDLGPLTFCMWHVKRTRVTLKEHGVQTKADRSAQPDRKKWVRCYIDIAFPAYGLPNWTREERLLDSIGAYWSGCRSGCSGQRAGSFEKTTARPRQLGHPRGRLQLQGLVAQPGAALHGNHQQSFKESLRMSLRMWHA